MSLVNMARDICLCLYAFALVFYQKTCDTPVHIHFFTHGLKVF